MDLKAKVEELTRSLEAKYQIELEVFYRHFPNEYSAIKIDAIWVPKEQRSIGIGSKVMEAIMEFADDHDLIALLTPSTDFGASSVNRLRKFYGQFGFVRNLGRNKDFRFSESMIRKPKTKKATASQNLREPLQDEPPKYSLTVYHTTSIEHWDSILSKGIIPGFSPPAGQDWNGEWSGKGIYCHLQPPYHEIDSNQDELTSITIEAKIEVPAGLVVPDEEFGTPDETPYIIESEGPIVVGQKIPPNTFKAVQLPDTDEARAWAKENVPSNIKPVFNFPD